MPNFSLVPPRPALSYTDDGGPEAMNVPHPTWIASYTNNGGTDYYVDPVNGSDANAGTSVGAAKATVFGASGAQAVASAGDTVHVVALTQDAVLREGAATLSKAITLQAYRLNAYRVIFDGRDDISGFTWTKDGAATRWFASVTSPARYALSSEWTNLQQPGANSVLLQDNNCVYALPLTIDGVVMLGCGSTAAVDATHAFHDYPNNRIYIGVDPTGKSIKMPMRQYAFTVSAAATVRGIVVRCYAAEYGGTAAMVKPGAGAWVFDNCIFGFSASDNVNVTGGATAGTFKRCHAVYGLTGWSHQSTVSGTTYVDCFAYKNNAIWKYSPAWHGGGWKLADVSGLTATWCWAESNYSCGFWRDFSGSNNTWRRCVALNNTEQGFLDEKTLASDATTNANRIVGCVAQGNWTGIHLSGAVKTVMVHNTLVNNSRSLRMVNDSRASHQWCSGLIWENNLCSLTRGHTVVAGTAPIAHTDASNQGAETGNFTTAFTSFQNTIWHTDPSVSLTNKFFWDDGTGVSAYSSRANWLAGKGSGLDTNGSEDTTSKSDLYLVDPQGYDWTPRVLGKVAGKTITTLTRDHVGTAAGLADSVAATVGALCVPGGRGQKFAAWDSFTRADSATSPGVATSGQTWTEDNGNGGISSNQFYFPDDTDLNLSTLATGVRDGHVVATVQGTLNSGSAYRIPRLVVRGIDATNYLCVELKNGSVTLYKRDAGSFTSLATQSGLTTADGTAYTLQVRCEGYVVKVWVDRVLQITHTLSSANDKYLGGTRVGFDLSKAGAPATNARADNLMVSRL